MKIGIRGLSFRQQFFTLLILVLGVIVLILPWLSSSGVGRIVRHALHATSQAFIERLSECPDEACMVDYLKHQGSEGLLRVTLLRVRSPEGPFDLMYDAHRHALPGEREAPPFNPSDHPEIMGAARTGHAEFVQTSKQFHELAAYDVQTFDAHGTPYMLRIALAYTQAQHMMLAIREGLYVTDALFVLVLLAAIGWIVYYLSRPIHAIVQAISPYAEGTTDLLPHIGVPSTFSTDFARLATTFNQLSSKAASHLENLQRERNEKASILEALTEGILAINRQGVVQYTNASLLHMMRLPPHSVIGQYLTSLPSSELLHHCTDVMEKALASPTAVTHSVQLGTYPMQFMDLIATKSPSFDGVVIVVQDKTAQYRVLEMGKEFVTNVSHELRTPVTVLKGYAETLQEQPSMPETLIRDIGDKMVRSCNRLGRLIQDLLTLASLEHRDSSELQPCSLAMLLHEVVHRLNESAPEATVDLQTPDEPSLIEGDASLLELAFTNLLENGVKYSTPPAHLSITVATHPEHVVVTISDQGIGIAPENIPRIFDRFYTVNKARSRQLGGAGIGLSIVKKIIDIHHGAIEVTSRQPPSSQQGTTFTIRFPAIVGATSIP